MIQHVRVTMEFDPQKTYFQAYIIHCQGFTCFAAWEANEVLLLKCHGNHGTMA